MRGVKAFPNVSRPECIERAAGLGKCDPAMHDKLMCENTLIVAVDDTKIKPIKILSLWTIRLVVYLCVRMCTCKLVYAYIYMYMHMHA